MSSSPLGEGPGEGAPEKNQILELKMVHFGAFWALYLQFTRIILIALIYSKSSHCTYSYLVDLSYNSMTRYTDMRDKRTIAYSNDFPVMRLVVHLIFLARGVFRGVFVLFGIEGCASKFGGVLGV